MLAVCDGFLVILPTPPAIEFPRGLAGRSSSTVLLDGFTRRFYSTVLLDVLAGRCSRPPGFHGSGRQAQRLQLRGRDGKRGLFGEGAQERLDDLRVELNALSFFQLAHRMADRQRGPVGA